MAFIRGAFCRGLLTGGLLSGGLFSGAFDRLPGRGIEERPSIMPHLSRGALVSRAPDLILCTVNYIYSKLGHFEQSKTWFDNIFFIVIES